MTCHASVTARCMFAVADRVVLSYATHSSHNSNYTTTMDLRALPACGGNTPVVLIIMFPCLFTLCSQPTLHGDLILTYVMLDVSRPAFQSKMRILLLLINCFIIIIMDNVR